MAFTYTIVNGILSRKMILLLMEKAVKVFTLTLVLTTHIWQTGLIHIILFGMLTPAHTEL